MNERIKELATEAGFMVDQSGSIMVCFTSTGDSEVKKFAELIVRECMELTHWKEFDMSREQRIRLSVYQDIKEHFGVDECMNQ